ncbi:MAG: DNA adenine methylase [Ardenticatenales bacterium]|nr:DNA adenine methylase [Ardenticatenales bacterium]
MPADRTFVPDAAPFLKWAGGKKSLLKQYADYLPKTDEINHYYEPFIGSAALFFHLQPARATLSDINGQLVDVYRSVQQRVSKVIAALRPHRNEEEHYYAVRALNPADLAPAEQAARLIYLNKTCYNGLYRENSQGQFNVPFGRYKNPKICDEERLKSASRALKGVRLRTADFAKAVAEAGPGDFVYFDPPYAPLSATSSFTSYSRHGFNADDQRRLAATFRNLSERDCKIMLSNSSAPLIYELYDGFHIEEIQARRAINSKADGRGPVKELLILNY